MKPSPFTHLFDALALIKAAREELALLPGARAAAERSGPPFAASVHLHCAICYARSARRSLALAARFDR